MLAASQLGLTTPIGHRPVTAAAVALLRQRLDTEAKRERGRILLCAAVGLLLNGCVVLGSRLLLWWMMTLHRRPMPHATRDALVIAAILCGLMLLIALLTKPAGRAERAAEVLRSERNSNGHGHDPIAHAGFGLLMLLALYGSYALVEAGKRAWMRCRLAGVNRDEVARLLAHISADPAGIAWAQLRAAGHSPASIRKPLAVLLLDGWVRLVDGGRSVMFQSPTMRSLHRRHPLAEVFSPGE